MSNWKPIELSVGDTVCNPAKPKWGNGVVLNVLPMGVIEFPDKTSVRYHRDNGGQRVSVRFGDGRTRTLLSPVVPLKVVKAELMKPSIKSKKK